MSMFAVTVLHVTANAQTLAPTSVAPSAHVAGDKSPTMARVIGIFPGAGHVYAGEKMRGLQYFGATLGAVVLGGIMTVADCSTGGSGASCEASGALLGPSLVLGVWGYTIYDAGRAAARTNAGNHMRVSLRIAPAHVGRVSTHDRLGVQLGLSIGAR